MEIARVPGVDRLTVNTVDSLIGQEFNHVILVLTVTKDGPGFLEDQRRMCVALSRARDSLTIIADNDEIRRMKRKPLHVRDMMELLDKYLLDNAIIADNDEIRRMKRKPLHIRDMMELLDKYRIEVDSGGRQSTKFNAVKPRAALSKYYSLQSQIQNVTFLPTDMRLEDFAPDKKPSAAATDGGWTNEPPPAPAAGAASGNEMTASSGTGAG